MGEVIRNIRTFALPNEQNTYTFAMKFEYDSWNRILGTTYPDGEHVRYWKGYTKHYYAGSERVIGVLFDAHEFRLDKLYFYKNAESGKMDRYFYHPDHIGSSSWITDNTGRPIQHLHYLPFGEDWVDQRTTSWNAPYTFSGKEKDTETGYGYFGARYYDSGLSIWLSVDPMSDKYPSMSPYNYCANNPVILVDPDGREVFLLGDYASLAYEYLVNTNPNITFTLDEETGQINGTANGQLTPNEQLLMDAMNPGTVDVKLEVSGVEQFKGADNILYNTTGGLGGYFLGNTINNGRAIAKQGICWGTLSGNFDDADLGQAISHEITEAYTGGLISLSPTVNRNAGIGSANESIYLKAHEAGTTVEQPMLKSEKQYQRNIRENQINRRQQQLNNQIFGPR